MLCSWPPGPKIYTHRRNQLLAIVAPVSEGEWLHLSGNLKNPLTYVFLIEVGSIFLYVLKLYIFLLSFQNLFTHLFIVVKV